MEQQRNRCALVNFVREAHQGQTDKSGLDYFESHLLPVARSVPADLYFAALAHDILEDTPTTTDDLKGAGFSAFEIQLIGLLTKPPKREFDYHYYLDQIAKNPYAKIIKVMDIVNNLSRMSTIDDEETSARLINKYLDALARLKF